MASICGTFRLWQSYIRSARLHHQRKHVKDQTKENNSEYDNVIAEVLVTGKVDVTSSKDGVAANNRILDQKYYHETNLFLIIKTSDNPDTSLHDFFVIYDFFSSIFSNVRFQLFFRCSIGNLSTYSKRWGHYYSLNRGHNSWSTGSPKHSDFDGARTTSSSEESDGSSLARWPGTNSEIYPSFPSFQKR